MEMSFVDLLRVRRHQKRMNQTELALAAGVSRNYISLIERGNIDGVSYKVFHRICQVLEMEFSISARPYEDFQDTE